MSVLEIIGWIRPRLAGRRSVALAVLAVALPWTVVGPAGASGAGTAGNAGTAAATPTITATPDSGLVDRQLVHVEGQGFEPNTLFEIFECTGDSVNESRCDPTNAFEVDSDSAGHVTSGFHVDARIYLGPTGLTAYDCRTEAAGCRIGVGLIAEQDHSAFANLGFDPSAPLSPVVTATATPSTGLTDGQTIAVTGRHLSDLEEGWVIECRTGGAPRACDLDRAVRMVPSGGRIDVNYTVHATFTSPLGDHVDCQAAAGACSIVVSWGFAFVADRVASVPLTFGLPPTTTTTTGTPLPPTGSSSGQAAALGIALVVLGCLAIALGRAARRRVS